MNKITIFVVVSLIGWLILFSGFLAYCQFVVPHMKMYNDYQRYNERYQEMDQRFFQKHEEKPDCQKEKPIIPKPLSQEEIDKRKIEKLRKEREERYKKFGYPYQQHM